ncbi:glycosyltransferase, partial [Streptosporangium subroseum]|uniref:glycosyltransferase n=1 Tax=Streptosporangium subroseum TaxID=106412 RepID=UPI00341EF960
MNQRTKGPAVLPGDRAGVRRVAFLIGQLGLGGTETQLCLLARELHDRGVEPHVLLLSKGGPHEASLREAGIGVHHLGFVPLSSGPSALPRNLRAFARLVGLLRRLEPDVLHAFLYVGYVLGAPAARLAGVPVVIAGRRSLSFYKRDRGWVLALERAATRLTDHVVANAAAVAEDARTVEHIPPHKISVIYNGLPPSAFTPLPPHPIDTHLPVILCVANLTPVKGHRFLLEAVATLARQGHPCTLVLAGDGPQRPHLQHQATTLGIDLRLLGPITDTRALLARADITVLPSLSEGLSNAVMESMAA